MHESDDGHADGFARYRIKNDWPGGIAANTLEVLDLYALDHEVETALWQFLVDIDLVANVRGIGRPMDESLRWRLADPRRLQIDRVTDHLWVRVVDPAVALAARTYSSDDRLVIDLTDPFLPANEGRWSIAGSGDGAEVRRTDADPDLALSAPELGALYLGGVSATTLAARRPDHGARARARSSGPTASSPPPPRRGAAPISERSYRSTSDLSCMIASMGPGSTSLSSAR